MRTTEKTYGIDPNNIRRAHRQRRGENWTPFWILLASAYATLALLIGAIILADQLTQGLHP